MNHITDSFEYFYVKLCDYFDLEDTPDGSKTYLIPKDIIYDHPIEWYQVIQKMGYLDDNLEDGCVVNEKLFWSISEKFISDITEYYNGDIIIRTNAKHGISVVNTIDAALSDYLVKYEEAER